MAVVPNLAYHRPSAVGAVLPGLGRVVPRTTASDVGRGAVLLGQLALDLSQRVLGAVARRDLGRRQPVVRGETSVVLDGGLEKVHHLLVLLVLGPVAGDVKGRVASRVLGKLVAPEIRVRGALVDPVRVHPGDQVVLAERREERVDAGALVRGHHGAVGQAVGRVGRRRRVVLPAQVAVLGVAAVAEVGPETVESPCVFGQELPFGLEARVCGPELSGEQEASVCFGAACVDGQRIGGGRAREYRWFYSGDRSVRAENKGPIGRQVFEALSKHGRDLT